MLDKLEVTSGVFLSPDDFEERLNGRICKRASFSRTDGYEVCDVFYEWVGNVQEVLVRLLSRPRHFGVNTKLSLNPGRFESYLAMDELIRQIAPRESLQIARLDFAVDVEAPIEWFNTRFTVPRKRIRKVYIDPHLQGLYFGKGADKVNVYDKARELGISGPITRIEVQKRWGRLPIRRYLDLPRLIDFDPFQGIRIDSVQTGAFDSAFEEQNADLLLRLFKEKGAQAARKLLNRQRNFQRDFDSLLKPDELLSFIRTQHKNQLERFFDGSGRRVRVAEEGGNHVIR